MSVRHIHAAVTAALLGSVALVKSAGAHALAQQDPVSVYVLSSGRLGAVVASLVGLAGVVIGGLALARAGRVDAANGARGAIVALMLGLIGMILGGLFVVTAGGGIGTGNGLAGAIVAVVLGAIGTILGGVALARSRRARLPG